MVYKTALVPDLERSSKGRWRFSPLPMGRKSSRTWYQYLGDQEVSSAAAVWAKLAGYYGWLMLPAEKGGAAIPGDQQVFSPINELDQQQTQNTDDGYCS